MSRILAKIFTMVGFYDLSLLHLVQSEFRGMDLEENILPHILP